MGWREILAWLLLYLPGRLHVLLVHVTPRPITGVQRSHDRVPSFFEVLRGMLAGRRVAAADMSAHKTLAQFHPALPGFNASLANITAGLHFAIRLFQMFALRHQTSDKNIAWMTISARRIPAGRLARRWSSITAAVRRPVYNEILRRIHS